MTNIELLTRCLEERHYDEIAAYALIDELMEARDMTRSEAERLVESVRRIGRDREEVVAATVLMRPSTRLGQMIRRQLRWRFDPYLARRITYRAVPGDQPPVLVVRYAPGIERRLSSVRFEVGARYVLDHYGAGADFDAPIPFNTEVIIDEGT